MAQLAFHLRAICKVNWVSTCNLLSTSDSRIELCAPSKRAKYSCIGVCAPVVTKKRDEGDKIMVKYYSASWFHGFADKHVICNQTKPLLDHFVGCCSIHTIHFTLKPIVKICSSDHLRRHYDECCPKKEYKKVVNPIERVSFELTLEYWKGVTLPSIVTLHVHLLSPNFPYKQVRREGM
jgi:hypothetical protein